MKVCSLSALDSLLLIYASLTSLLNQADTIHHANLVLKTLFRNKHHVGERRQQNCQHLYVTRLDDDFELNAVKEFAKKHRKT